MKKQLLIMSIACLGLLKSVTAEVTIEAPWVREAPPTAKMLASYMVLHNNGDTSEILKSAAAKGFNRVEIHRTTINNGIASMEAQDSLEIPAKESVVLQPGSYHLMLIDGDHHLQEGENVEISLNFANDKTIEIQAPVRKAPNAPEGHGSKEHHGEHHH